MPKILRKEDQKWQTVWEFTLTQIEIDAMFNTVVNNIFENRDYQLHPQFDGEWYFVSQDRTKQYVTVDTVFYYKDEVYLYPTIQASGIALSIESKNNDENNYRWV